jgi:hypothetical protein
MSKLSTKVKLALQQLNAMWSELSHQATYCHVNDKVAHATGPADPATSAPLNADSSIVVGTQQRILSANDKLDLLLGVRRAPPKNSKAAAALKDASAVNAASDVDAQAAHDAVPDVDAQAAADDDAASDAYAHARFKAGLTRVASGSGSGSGSASASASASGSGSGASKALPLRNALTKSAVVRKSGARSKNLMQVISAVSPVTAMSPTSLPSQLGRSDVQKKRKHQISWRSENLVIVVGQNGITAEMAQQIDRAQAVADPKKRPAILMECVSAYRSASR